MSPDQESRAKNFGIIAAIGGMSFILAILLGGILTDPEYSSYFNPSLPFWITASLAYINFILMVLLFHETHQPSASTSLNPFRGIKNLAIAVRLPYLRMLYLINFFFMLSWVTSMQFFPTTLIRTFHYGTKQITIGLMAVGMMWSLSNLLVNRYLSKRFYPAKTLLIGLLIQSACLLFF